MHKNADFGDRRARRAENPRMRSVWCATHAPSSRLYLATMQPFGAAAQARIARHRALRQGKGFETCRASDWGLRGLTPAPAV